MDQVEIQYARSDDVNIAYQVIGDGPMDVVLVQGWISSIEAAMELPSYVRFVDRLASFSRLILFDKRGTGSSDRVSIDKLPSLEQRMDDVRAVMDAVGSERAALIGSSEGGPMSMVFAATYPERTTGLVLFGTFTSARNPAYSANPERQPFSRHLASSTAGSTCVEYGQARPVPRDGARHEAAVEVGSVRNHFVDRFPCQPQNFET